VSALFSKLKRVEIIDKRRAGGWSADEIAELAVAQAKQYGGCLVVVNTKKAARVVYESCRQHGVRCFHLSTLMCPTHRMAVLAEVKAKLGNESFVCVSTQLIEAGVDVDFGSVIRVLAGLDSIAQAAGRCNRNGRMAIGYTYVVNADWERIDSLPDIKIAAEVAQRVLDEVRREPKANSVDLLSPQVMKRFYQYYFHNRSDVMGYPFDKSHFDREDSLLSLLSENRMSAPSQLGFRQAFMTAGKIFQVIDTPSRGVVVPYGDAGRAIIAELSAAFDLSLQYELLRRAQRFTVNLFPNVLESLMERHAVQEAQPDTGVLVLDERFYSSEFGVSEDAVNDLSSCIV
jgi:CRISPR-associated endonuclease/helicase Cas3